MSIEKTLLQALNKIPAHVSEAKKSSDLGKYDARLTRPANMSVRDAQYRASLINLEVLRTIDVPHVVDPELPSLG